MTSELSAPMRDLLFRVCRSNGGGVSAYCENMATVKALYNRDLVQGKAGEQSCIVHTRKGLALYRSMVSA